jgi:hypothetical protein
VQAVTYTNNADEIGLHVFEKAGLGKAPFKVVGSFELKWQAHPGAPIRAGGSCDYCGNAIMYAARIRGADGRTFKVGSDCVARTGDAGLLKAYKQHPETRKLNRAKAALKDEAKKMEFAALMADPAVRAKLAAIKIEYHAPGKFRPVLEIAENAWKYCGASGRARYLKMVKHHLAKAG